MPYLTVEIAPEFIRPFLHLGKRFLVVQPTLPKFQNLDRVDIGSIRGAMENIILRAHHIFTALALLSFYCACHGKVLSTAAARCTDNHRVGGDWNLYRTPDQRLRGRDYEFSASATRRKRRLHKRRKTTRARTSVFRSVRVFSGFSCRRRIPFL